MLSTYIYDLSAKMNSLYTTYEATFTQNSEMDELRKIDESIETKLNKVRGFKDTTVSNFQEQNSMPRRSIL